MSTITKRHEVEVDEAIVAAYEKVVLAHSFVVVAARSICSASGAREDYKTGALYTVADDYKTRVIVDFEWCFEQVRVKGPKRLIADYEEKVEKFEAAQKVLAIAKSKYEGWSRFYLVMNVNGHIHSNMNCSTCFPTTQFAWVTSLSGLTEADAVAEQGEILCSVCFPTAPVAWTNGENKIVKAEKEARAAERAAKKAAKLAAICTGTGEIASLIVEKFERQGETVDYVTSELRCPACNAKKYSDHNSRELREQRLGRVPQHNTPKPRAKKGA